MFPSWNLQDEADSRGDPTGRIHALILCADDGIFHRKLVMDLFKVKKFRKAHKPKPENVTEDNPVPEPEEQNTENGDVLIKSVMVDNPNVDNSNADAEDDDDDDDFITNEVMRRLEELSMVLIPEEESFMGEEKEEEEIEVATTEWRDVESELRRASILVRI